MKGDAYQVLHTAYRILSMHIGLAGVNPLHCRGERLGSTLRDDESEQWVVRGLELGASDDLATQFLGLSVRSRPLARAGDMTAALAVADRVDGLAKISDDPRDPADAALNRAEINHLAGNHSAVNDMIDEAVKHYIRMGATAYVERARRLAATWAGSQR